MITLAINTASARTEIALLDSSGKLIKEKSWLSKNTEAEKLMPEIKNLFNESGNNFDEVKKVICVKGPGSFTGLRVGVTVANTFATLNNCELFAVDTFEYLWKEKENRDNMVLLIFAGNLGVYVAMNGENADSAKLINLDQLPSAFKIGDITFFGDVSDSQKEFLQKHNLKFSDRTKSFGQIMEEIFADIEVGKFKKVKIIEPVYIKKPQITESKKTIFV